MWPLLLERGTYSLTAVHGLSAQEGQRRGTRQAIVVHHQHLEPRQERQERRRERADQAGVVELQRHELRAGAGQGRRDAAAQVAVVAQGQVREAREALERELERHPAAQVVVREVQHLHVQQVEARERERAEIRERFCERCCERPESFLSLSPQTFQRRAPNMRRLVRIVAHPLVCTWDQSSMVRRYTSHRTPWHPFFLLAPPSEAAL